MIRAEDIKIEYFYNGKESVTSAQPRGVRLTHIPTGLSTVGQDSPKRILNQVDAMAELDKLVYQAPEVCPTSVSSGDSVESLLREILIELRKLNGRTV